MKCILYTKLRLEFSENLFRSWVQALHFAIASTVLGTLRQGTSLYVCLIALFRTWPTQAIAMEVQPYRQGKKSSNSGGGGALDKTMGNLADRTKVIAVKVGGSDTKVCRRLELLYWCILWVLGYALVTGVLVSGRDLHIGGMTRWELDTNALQHLLRFSMNIVTRESFV